MNKVWRLIGIRLALGCATLLVVSLVVFIAVSSLPGDVAEETLGSQATPEAVEVFRKQLGLDLPPYIRYFDWLGKVLAGEFGRSFVSNRPIAGLIGDRLVNTLYLAAFAGAIAVTLGLSLGILLARYRGSWLDRLMNAFVLTCISLPQFLIAYLLIIALAVDRQWFPPLAYVDGTTGLGTRLYVSALPALVLAITTAAHIMRMTRASIVSVMSSPYMEMARLKGVDPRRLILTHALPNALAPIISVVALNLAYLVVGVVIVEVIFVYPGLGQLLIDAVSKRDIPVIQIVALIFAMTYVLLNTAADIATILVNPRILHPRQGG